MVVYILQNATKKIQSLYCHFNLKRHKFSAGIPNFVISINALVAELANTLVNSCSVIQIQEISGFYNRKYDGLVKISFF